MEKNEKPEDMAEAARQRSHVYGLLATIYDEEPNADLIRQFRNPEFQEVLSGLGVELEGDFFGLPEEKIAEDLAVEYARLFLGPGRHISPHESVHLTEKEGGGLLWGEATVEVKRFIESSGLEYRSDYNGMPDHISVEFEFMQELAKQEARAWEEKAGDGARHCLKIQKRFLEEHLVPWVPRFCDEVIMNAELSYYRELAKLTRSFIEFEGKEVKR